MSDYSNTIEYGELRLRKKPSAALRYSYLAGDNATDTLVLFINGLMLPQSGWEPAMMLISQDQSGSRRPRPALLSYDRFGQGLSDPDPADVDKPNGHDLTDVVRDLRDFLVEFSELKSPNQPPWGQPGDHRLVFVCNSIGCPIARLFAQSCPGVVSAFVFLDSMMANTDFVSMFPDPDAADFDKSSLPDGLTEEDIRKARKVYGQFFHPTVRNKEGLDRSNAAQLLPYSDKPQLQGPGDRSPLLTVVGHDWDLFAAENTRSFGLPKGLCREYINPHWHRYNQGLARLTNEQWSKGPIIAQGCGHFIQRDSPEFVASEVLEILERLQSSFRLSV